MTTSSRIRARRLRFAGADFAGGTDSLPALVAAWDLAAAEPGSVVLWIHGPQPVLLASPEPLRQRIERRRDGPPIYAFAAVGGENLVLTSLSDAAGAHTVPRLSAGADDLAQFLRTSRRQRRAHRRRPRARDRWGGARIRNADVGPSGAAVGARSDRRALRGAAGMPPRPRNGKRRWRWPAAITW